MGKMCQHLIGNLISNDFTGPDEVPFRQFGLHPKSMACWREVEVEKLINTKAHNAFVYFVFSCLTLFSAVFFLDLNAYEFSIVTNNKCV